MRRLVRLEAAESGQKSPKTVISRQAVQSVVNQIGGAGEGGRESCSARLGAAIGHPSPQDAAAAIRVGKSARRIRPAPRPEGGAGRPRLSAPCPWGRRADSPIRSSRRPCGASARLFRVLTADGGAIVRILRLQGVRAGCAEGATAPDRLTARRRESLGVRLGRACARTGSAARDRLAARRCGEGDSALRGRECESGCGGGADAPFSPRALTTHPPLAANGRRSSMESFADCAQSRSLSEQSKPTPALRMRPDTGRWRFGKCFLAR